jgi:Arc/MetJ-type ribon-helix-helix transcriptional regulator
LLSQKQKKTLTVNMTAPYVEGMATLIEDGLYTNQTEIVKDALRRLFLHYEIKMVTEEPT